MRAFVLLVALACCRPPTSPKLQSDPPPVVERLAPRIELSVTGDAAENYGDAPSSGGVPLAAADGLFAKLSQLREVELQRDARLDIAASDLSALVRADAEISDGAVAFVLRSHGILEPAARVVAVVGGFDVSALKPDLAPENVRVGIGGSPPVILLVHSMLATLDPVPRRTELQGFARLRGRVDARFHAPHFTVTTDGRAPQRLVVDSSDGGSFDARLECGDLPGTRWVALEACDADNRPTPLALFPIECGVPLPTKYYVEPRANLQGSDRERRIMALLNRQRVASGLEPLRPDPRLVRVAHSYAEQMSRARSVAHELGGTTPSERIRDAGMIPPVTIESTLQANGLGAAAEVLWNDPAYRVTFEKREATHVGVGVVEDAHHELYIDIDLARVVPVADLQRVRERLQARIREATDRAVKVDTTLQRFADRAAEELAAGREQEELSKHLGRELMLSMPKGTILDSTQVVLRDLDEWNDDLLMTMVPFDSFGVGVAQTARDGRDAGQLWVVAFFAAQVNSHH